MSTTYKSLPNQTLALTVEIDYTSFPEILNAKQTDFDEAVFIVSGIVQIFKASELKVSLVELSDEKDMNFHAVHCRPPPEAYFTHPLAIEIVFPPKLSGPSQQEPSTDKKITVFGHIYCNLTYFDGLATLNSLYNVLEHVEHHIIRPTLRDGRPSLFKSYSVVQREGHLSLGEQFKIRNGKYIPTWQMWIRSWKHYLSLQWLTIVGTIQHYWLNSKSRFIVGPLSYLSKENRVYKRYSPNVTFNEFMTMADKSQKRLGYPYAAYTLNFSPLVAVGFCNRILDLKNESNRKNNLVFPPGPAPNVGPPFIAAVSNGVLWNNYGRHDPHISGMTKAFLWDFVPIPAHFSPFFLAVTIQGTLYTLVNMPQPLYEKVEDLLQPLGEGTVYPNINLASLSRRP